MTEHEKTCEYHFCNYKLWDETAFCIKSGDFERAEKKYEKLSEMPDGQEELTRRRFASVYEGVCEICVCYCKAQERWKKSLDI